MSQLGVSKEVGHRLLGDMLRIRRFEEKSAEKYSEGKIRGFLHLYIGEEAIAAGAHYSLEEEDNILTTYREHGHALMRGVPADRIMAEMYGKYEGCSKGRGGSMHLFDISKRFYGGNAIVAGHIPMAVGLAMADKMKGREQLTACFFGEGAMAEGAFHEALNLAALWKLPVLFLCENNYYAMGTALERSESQTDLCAKVRAYNVPAESVDGMDVVDVVDAVHYAGRRVRTGEGPMFLEFRTYRFRAHSMFDAELYREKAEVELHKKDDPIETFAKELRDAGQLSDDEFAALDKVANDEVQAAVAFAEKGTLEPVEDLAKDVYCREVGCG